MSIKRNKPKKKLPPIVIVPDKSYTDDKGTVIPTDVILIADLTVYSKIRMILTEMAKRQNQ